MLPKLVVSCAEPLEYFALSHCWDGSLPLRTTTINFHDHFETIAWDALPATFRYAVDVTRSMDYQYLWIDGLCIIQDSEEDWLRECALIGEVYAGAALTIVAGKSNSPSDGIFGASDRYNHTCNIQVEWLATGATGDLVIGLPPSPSYASFSLVLTWPTVLNVVEFSKSECCLDECYTCPEMQQASFVHALKASTVFYGQCL